MWRRWCSGRRRARPPARLGGLTSFGAAPRSPPVPSGPSGALHTGGAGCADDCLGVSSRSPARPCRRVACSVGLGRCVCRWAAARPRDRHTRACGSEWSISRPALALPPPTGTATSPHHRAPAPQPGPPHLRALARQALAPLTPAPTTNFARNSPATASSFELRSLELQRFQTSLKLQQIELRATFVEGRP